MILRLSRLLRLHRLMAADDEFASGGGGDTAGTDVAPAAAVEGEAPAQAPAGPTSMLDAMFPRDEKGRFAPRAGAEGEAPAVEGEAKPAAAPAAPTAAAPGAAVPPAKPADPLAMPEGLQPKAQERFQMLANTLKEREAQVQTLEQQVSYVRDTFQQHGIRQDQFEQAAGVIGALNRGDFAAAQQMLVEQLRQVSLMTGQTLPGVDALQEFPDLRQKVDALQISEADALELARMRKTAAALQGRQQQETQQRDQVEQQRKAHQAGTAAVDAWVGQMAASDLDWPAIEAQLLPNIKDLLGDVPPQAWVRVLQAQYKVLKGAAGALRRTPTPSGAGEPSPLRPLGAGAPQRAPSSMHEAMWGTSSRA